MQNRFVTSTLTLIVTAYLWTARAEAEAPPGMTVFVSASAEEDGDGTRQRPFSTLEAARDAIRAKRKDGSLPTGEIVVEVLPGRLRCNQPFVLSADDAGTKASPIVYRATEPGTAILSAAIPLAGWQPVADPAVATRLDPEARSHVVWIDLPKEPPQPVPGFANGGCGYAGKPEYPLALFQNGRRLPVSRWPNRAFAKMGPCVGRHEEHGHVGTAYIDGTFIFDNERLIRWIGEPDAWFDGLWFHHWADQKMQLKQIDPQAKTIALANPKSHRFGYKEGQQFFAFNMISEIDRPGEWAVDRQSRRLYLWPESNPNEATVFLAVGDHLVTMTDVANVQFEGLTLEGCRETAFVAKNCRNVSISGCTLRQLGSWGIAIDGGNECTVFGCDLYDLGEGGIQASGGIRNTLEPGGHLIENNHIHHFGRIVSTYRPGVAVHGVGNKVRHNLIYETQHQAIAFVGNDHLIEYNIAHDVCLHSSDAGAIYACARDWSRRGTVIRHNLFHALGQGLDGCGCRAIYLDDMTSGTIVQSNIVTMSDCGLNFGGGQDNLISDNIAISCATSVNLSSRGVDSFARKNAEKGRESAQYRLLSRDESLFRGELWSKRYPRLLAPLEMDPIDAQNAHFNVIRHNVNVGGGPVVIRNAKNVMRTCTVEENIDLSEDPGFVDVSSLDLRLRRNGRLFDKLPDFQPPDFARMGLYDDPRRASAAVKFGPQVSRLAPIMSPEARREAEQPVLVSVPAAERAIQVDGSLTPSEWQLAAGSETAVLAEIKDGSQPALPSRVWLTTDDTQLYIAMEHTIAPGAAPTDGADWGQDDGVEIVLAPARDERLPNRLEGIMLRGYASGALTIERTGQPLGTTSDNTKTIRYAANHSSEGNWTAEFAIPFSAIGLSPFETNLPVFCHVTVRKPAANQWVTWRQRWSSSPADPKCACALWLRQFGCIPFTPGLAASVIRIDIQGDRDVERPSMTPGEGTSAPAWAVKWNRLLAQFGAARADRWKPCRFEFTPLEDTTVRLELMGSQSPPDTPPAWTYYDGFRVEGAELVNGDFEIPAEHERFPGWNGIPRQVQDSTTLGDHADIIDLGRAAASGSKVARTSHDYRISQPIAVRKGQKVIVTFQARAALPGDAARSAAGPVDSPRNGN